ncbi:MAG TPA: hypothetical protein VNH11_27555 [Pirellulales bacterium]|nr:hypothetical protein [Pirellulales bacterium]
MRRGCLIFCGLLFCAFIGSLWVGIPKQPAPQGSPPFYLVNRFGQRQIVVVAPRGDTDELAAVMAAVKHLDRGPFCWLLFWLQANRAAVPTEMPMTSEAEAAMLGSYQHNERTGHRRLLLRGREIKLRVVPRRL